MAGKVIVAPLLQFFKLVNPVIKPGAFLTDFCQTDIFGNQRTIRNLAVITISGENSV